MEPKRCMDITMLDGEVLGFEVNKEFVDEKGK